MAQYGFRFCITFKGVLHLLSYRKISMFVLYLKNNQQIFEK